MTMGAGFLHWMLACRTIEKKKNERLVCFLGVLVNKELLTCTEPVNKELLTGTLELTRNHMKIIDLHAVNVTIKLDKVQPVRNTSKWYTVR